MWLYVCACCKIIILVFYDCHYWVLLKMFFATARTLHEHYTVYSQSDKRIREVMIEDSTTENQVNSVVKALSTLCPAGKIRGPATQRGSFVKHQPIFEIRLPLERLLNFSFSLSISRDTFLSWFFFFFLLFHRPRGDDEVETRFLHFVRSLDKSVAVLVSKLYALGSSLILLIHFLLCFLLLQTPST